MEGLKEVKITSLAVSVLIRFRFLVKTLFLSHNLVSGKMSNDPFFPKSNKFPINKIHKTTTTENKQITEKSRCVCLFFSFVFMVNGEQYIGDVPVWW